MAAKILEFTAEDIKRYEEKAKRAKEKKILARPHSSVTVTLYGAKKAYEEIIGRMGEKYIKIADLLEVLLESSVQPLIELSEEQDRTAVYNARKGKS